MVALAPHVALADTTGTISGVVIDATTRRPLCGARVLVTSPAEVRTLTTDRNGRFYALALTVQPVYFVQTTYARHMTTVVPIGVDAGITSWVELRVPKQLLTISHIPHFPPSIAYRLAPKDVYVLQEGLQLELQQAAPQAQGQ